MQRGVPYDACMHFFRRHDKGRLPHQDVLTPAEWRVLEHIRARRTNAEIAVRLGLSVNTVRTHVSSMLAKVEVTDREELARWSGEPAAVSRVALERRGVTFAAGPLAWFHAAWTRVGPVTKVFGGVVVAGALAAAVFVAASASREAPAEVRTPQLPSIVPTERPTLVAGPVLEWAVGAPIAWPEGVTLVLGTGCFQCGGQLSTFEIVDATGRFQLPKAEGEEHWSVAADDPAHLYLNSCVDDCNIYSEIVDPQSVLYESFDRGVSWMEVGRSLGFFEFIGRLGNGELLRSRYLLPLPYAYDRFPSGTPVTPPSLARPDWPPGIIDGDIVWLASGGQQLLDEYGAVAWDFEQLIPDAAEFWGVVDGPGSALAVKWQIENTYGVTTIDGTAVEIRSSAGLAVDQFEWLDADHFIASVQYPEEMLPGWSASRVPTLVDLRTGTLYPFEQFLDATDFHVWGRNLIEAIWQD